jgi:hypothetical protein
MGVSEKRRLALKNQSEPLRRGEQHLRNEQEST